MGFGDPKFPLKIVELAPVVYGNPVAGSIVGVPNG